MLTFFISICILNINLKVHDYLWYLDFRKKPSYDKRDSVRMDNSFTSSATVEIQSSIKKESPHDENASPLQQKGTKNMAFENEMDIDETNNENKTNWEKFEIDEEKGNDASQEEMDGSYSLIDAGPPPSYTSSVSNNVPQIDQVE